MQPTLATPGEPKQKLPPVAMVGQVPDLSGDEMPMRACHRWNSDNRVFGAEMRVIGAVWRWFCRLSAIKSEYYLGPTPATRLPQPRLPHPVCPRWTSARSFTGAEATSVLALSHVSCSIFRLSRKHSLLPTSLSRLSIGMPCGLLAWSCSRRRTGLPRSTQLILWMT